MAADQMEDLVPNRSKGVSKVGGELGVVEAVYSGPHPVKSPIGVVEELAQLDRVHGQPRRCASWIRDPAGVSDHLPPNGLELSCPAAWARPDPLSRILTGKAPRPFRTPAGSAAASCYACRKYSILFS